jgi:5-hydroxyisourate hydrolase-like protein (transthyretin family)
MHKSALLLSAIILIASCSSPKTETAQFTAPRVEPAKEMAKLTDWMKKYEAAPQTFAVSSKKSSQVRGKQGTLIQVNLGDYETVSGKPIGKGIQVELIELTNQRQMLANRAQTASNGRLLVSGGAYYLNMTSQGEQLKLRKGKKLSVQFARRTEKEMSLFYGQRDSLDQMNWLPAGQKMKEEAAANYEIKYENRGEDSVAVSIKTYNEWEAIGAYLQSDSVSPSSINDGASNAKRKARQGVTESDYEGKINQKMYEIAELNSFGWINCDQFYDIDDKDKTDLRIAFPSRDSVSSAMVFLVFTDLNSILSYPYFSNGKQPDPAIFNDIPAGAKVKLLSYTLKNDKPYVYHTNLTIKPQETLTVHMQETTETQLFKLFDKKK